MFIVQIVGIYKSVAMYCSSWHF